MLFRAPSSPFRARLTAGRSASFFCNYFRGGKRRTAEAKCMGDMSLQCRQPGTTAVKPVPGLVPVKCACASPGGLQCEGGKVQSAACETGAASGCKGPSAQHNPCPTTCSRVPQHRLITAAALADSAGPPLHPEALQGCRLCAAAGRQDSGSSGCPAPVCSRRQQALSGPHGQSPDGCAQTGRRAGCARTCCRLGGKALRRWKGGGGGAGQQGIRDYLPER